MRRRPVLMGIERNPRVPGHLALDPRVRGGSGHRLLTYSGLTLQQFEETFERVNAKDDPVILPGSVVVVLGREAWSWLGLYPLARWFDQASREDSTYILLPHPSGKNLWYNRAENVTRVHNLLWNLSCQARSRR